ncbi:hypothetical protein [Mediannikoviicoccus vaginalis]|uniref:hypothetical protein n=1 Tax=Mediannikoviicoccus vaginalis TaxID=2899727 RepID=UPI001F27A8A4|nr:hypothetical protein [Mediannikoviicoccus vaginalis]
MFELKLLEIQKKIEENYKKVCIESGEKLIKRFLEIENFSPEDIDSLIDFIAGNTYIKNKYESIMRLQKEGNLERRKRKYHRKDKRI